MTKPAELIIGTQVFRITHVEDLDARQDGWITAVLERAGLTDPRLDPLEGPALVREAELLLMERGLVGRFLAGYLVEVGKAWETASADANARLFDSVKGKGHRDGIFVLLGGLVLGFFAGARASWPTGPSSSKDPDADANSESAAASTTATGSLSSVP
jgi:hypothetical protein